MNKFIALSQDAEQYLCYRNKVYSRNDTFPLSKMGRLKLVSKMFLKNTNGFRDLAYFRIGSGRMTGVIKKLFPPTNNLVIECNELSAGGCVFHHAFSTYINAHSIGRHCSFRNNTTIGEKNGLKPILEDGVFVGPNVVIIGNVRIGRNAVIGAGSVVVKDVPSYAVVAGNPARVITILEK